MNIVPDEAAKCGRSVVYRFKKREILLIPGIEVSLRLEEKEGAATLSLESATLTVSHSAMRE